MSVKGEVDHPHLKVPNSEAIPKILRNVSLTAITVVPVLYWVNKNAAISTPKMSSATDRMIFTLQCHALTMVVLVNMILLVLNVRVKSSWNPLNPATADAAKVPVQILTNTLEQTVIFVPSTLILSTYLEEASMKIMPILVVTFAVGRMLFAYGYLKSPLYRSPGFATTLVANLGAVFGVIYFTLLEQPALIAYPTAALMGLGTVSSGLTMLSSLL